ncbi:recombinase family protein [Nocardioides panacisoli]|uniref:recombinase family protein n=1 Tax=Nocardioides panacisoli TaxID=627624 RepID=UPI001C62F8A8|nr:recombinase family protein [Nocardioides panacisoli]QYJ04239.1 recombinase family protein [Nocardioides panacisoli]
MRAGIYVRISSDTDGTGLGVARQRTDCEALAARLGWHVQHVYEDNDVSATSGRERPAYARMVRDIERGQIEAVIVWDVDRLTRTPRELEDVIDWAERQGLRLASVGGDIDLATEQGRMLARMKGTVARYEVEQSSRRLRAKHAELASAGRHVGPRPFGWDFVDTDGQKNLRVNQAEAAVIRECVRRLLAGEGLWKIRNDLNDRGITTATGGPWQTQTLRRMLLRWRNCGVRSHRGREVGPGQWAQIIDRETHERVIATLTDPARRANNRGTAIRYLLTGIALCGECDRPVVGTNEFTYKVKGYKRKNATEAPTKLRVYPHSYKCPHAGCMKVQRRMSDVDEVVESVVIDLLERNGVKMLGGDPAAAEEARTRIKELRAKLDLAADQFSNDLIDGEQLTRITARVRPELEAERARLHRSEPDDDLSEFTGDTARQAWKRADVERKRRVLRALSDRLKMKIAIDRIGPGNGAEFNPESVPITFGDES